MGRAGINTALGYFPFGSMIVKGIYVMRDEPLQGTNHQMEFKSIVPYHSNIWGTGYVINSVVSNLYGKGKSFLTVPMAQPARNEPGGMNLNIRGSLVFSAQETTNPVRT